MSDRMGKAWYDDAVAPRNMGVSVRGAEVIWSELKRTAHARLVDCLCLCFYPLQQCFVVLVTRYTESVERPHSHRPPETRQRHDTTRELHVPSQAELLISLATREILAEDARVQEGHRQARRIHEQKCSQALNLAANDALDRSLYHSCDSDSTAVHQRCPQRNHDTIPQDSHRRAHILRSEYRNTHRTEQCLSCAAW